MAITTLAERLQLALDRLPGATQADLARHCGLRGPSVSNWFTGETKALKYGSAKRAAEFLRCDRDWLSDGVGLPLWREEAPTAKEERGAYWVEPMAAAPAPALPTLSEALEVLGMALANDMPPAARAELAEMMAAWTRHKGKDRYRTIVAELLEPQANHGAPAEKRTGTD